MDARTQAWIDQEDAHMVAIIRSYGWFIQYVGGGPCSYPGCDCSDSGTPSFAYTVGMFGLAHPELLIFGVEMDTAAAVLNALGGRIRDGEVLLPGHLLTLDEWPYRLIPEPVPNPGEIVLAANRFYQRPAEHSVPVLQLGYADTVGRFPWEDGSAAAEMQPRPGTFKA